jgi:putative Mg2+ transporter-C (MgtC) family protein
MDAFLATGDITFYNGVFRLFLAVVAGGLIGVNREKYNRAAGFRTHILICLGSSLLMLISIFIPQEFLDFESGDPGRIAAQVVAGLAFWEQAQLLNMAIMLKVLQQLLPYGFLPPLDWQLVPGCSGLL